MKRLLLASTFLAFTSPTFAQTATAVGTGIANSTARSQAAATAIGGGAGGNAAGGNAAVTVNSAATPASTVSTINNTGTQTVRNVPTVFAPGLSAAGLETCLGSVSGGAGWLGTGITLGGSIKDDGCNRRLWARTLYSMKLQKAAVSMMCQDSDVYRAMVENQPDGRVIYLCDQYLPRTQAVGYPGPGPIFGVTPVTYNANAEVIPADGSILLIDGKTGKERLCNNYNQAQQRCRVWAYTSHPKKTGSKTHTAAQPTSAGGSPPSAGANEGKSQ